MDETKNPAPIEDTGSISADTDTPTNPTPNDGSVPESPVTASSDRVFEFTSDLDIAPIKNADEPVVSVPIPPEARPQTPLQDAIGRINMPPKMREAIAGVPVPKDVSPIEVAPIKKHDTASKSDTANKPDILSNAGAMAVGSSPPASPTDSNKTEGTLETTEGSAVPPPTFTDFDHDRDLRASLRGVVGREEMETGFNGKDPVPRAPELSHTTDTQKAIRTYESDVAEAMARKKTSTASIVISEKKRADKQRKMAAVETAPAETVEKAAETPEPVEAPIQPSAEPEEEPLSIKIPKTDAPITAADVIPAVIVPPEPEIPQRVLSAQPQEPVYSPPNEEPAMFVSSEPVPHEVKRSGNTALKIFIVALCIIFVLAGGLGAYYLYSQSPLAGSSVSIARPNENSTRGSTKTALVPTDSRVVIATDGLNPNDILGRIRNEIRQPQAVNTIKQIILSQNKNSGATALSAGELIKTFNIPAPDMLDRALTGNWLLGVYADANGNKNVFVIATHNFFQNAFAGMLSWEKNMPDDLKPFLVDPGNASPQNFSLHGHFVDGLVKNRDAREYQTADGNIIFLYSFIDSSKLVLAANEQTLAEIVRRLEQQQYIR